MLLLLPPTATWTSRLLLCTIIAIIFDGQPNLSICWSDCKWCPDPQAVLRTYSMRLSFVPWPCNRKITSPEASLGSLSRLLRHSTLGYSYLAGHKLMLALGTCIP